MNERLLVAVGAPRPPFRFRPTSEMQSGPTLPAPPRSLVLAFDVPVTLESARSGQINRSLMHSAILSYGDQAMPHITVDRGPVTH
jgi:hypothetical protein